MLDAFARAIRKPQQGLGYEPVLPTVPLPPPGIRLRREPDGPVSIKSGNDRDFYIPSPFRVGYVKKCLFYSI